MKNKIIWIALIWVLILTTSSLGATKEQVIGALYATYPVGDTTYRLPDSIVAKAVKFLNKKELTSEQYDVLLSAAYKVADIADKAGTTDIKEMDKEDVMEGLGALVTVSETIDVDIEQELAENNISIESITTSIATGEDPVIEEPKEEPKEEEPVIKDSPKQDEKIENLNQQEQDISKQDENATIQETTLSGEDVPIEVSQTSGDNTSKTESSKGLFETFLTDDDDKELTGWKKWVAQTERALKKIKTKTGWKFQEFWDKAFKIVVVVTCIILFLLFLIICLLFKRRWNKMIKCILIVLFVLVFLAILVSFILALVYLRELKALFKLYYIFT